MFSSYGNLTQWENNAANNNFNNNNNETNDYKDNYDDDDDDDAAVDHDHQVDVNGRYVCQKKLLWTEIFHRSHIWKFTNEKDVILH